MKRTLLFFCILSITLSCLADSQTFYAYEGDASIDWWDINYQACHDNWQGSTYAGGSTANIGQDYGDQYYIRRTILPFNTNNLPSEAVITSVTLSIAGMFDHSTSDFDLCVVNSTMDSPYTVIHSDFNNLGSNIMGALYTSIFSTSGYNSIQLNIDGINYINNDDWTVFGLRSWNDIYSNAPSGEEWVAIRTANSSSLRPKLVVNYTVPVNPPASEFIGSPTSGEVSLEVCFTNQSSGNISSYSWNFGDGYTSTSTNPCHTYHNSGSYTVRLTAFGPGGNDIRTRINYIIVSDPIPPPASEFIGSPTSGEVSLEVCFTNQSSGNISSYSWNFGDGYTSTSTNPCHTYHNSGSYTVSLTAFGPGGNDIRTRTNYITVSNPPIVITSIKYYNPPFDELDLQEIHSNPSWVLINAEAMGGDPNSIDEIPIHLQGVYSEPLFEMDLILQESEVNSGIFNILTSLSPLSELNFSAAVVDVEDYEDSQYFLAEAQGNIRGIARGSGGEYPPATISAMNAGGYDKIIMETTMLLSDNLELPTIYVKCQAEWFYYGGHGHSWMYYYTDPATVGCIQIYDIEENIGIIL